MYKDVEYSTADSSQDKDNTSQKRTITRDETRKKEVVKKVKKEQTDAAPDGDQPLSSAQLNKLANEKQWFDEKLAAIVATEEEITSKNMEKYIPAITIETLKPSIAKITEMTCLLEMMVEQKTGDVKEVEKQCKPVRNDTNELIKNLKLAMVRARKMTGTASESVTKKRPAASAENAE